MTPTERIARAMAIADGSPLDRAENYEGMARGALAEVAKMAREEVEEYAHRDFTVGLRAFADKMEGE